MKLSPSSTLYIPLVVSNGYFIYPVLSQNACLGSSFDTNLYNESILDLLTFSGATINSLWLILMGAPAGNVILNGLNFVHCLLFSFDDSGLIVCNRE